MPTKAAFLEENLTLSLIFVNLAMTFIKAWGLMEWHHLFGLTLKDFFTDSAYRVELEKDLSLEQQFLDVVIIEQHAGLPVPELPDGLENLARHNLLTYKSIRQPLTGWTLDELIGHYANYRKQISPSFKKLLPVEDFRLYAVTTREPEKLATEASLVPFKKGGIRSSVGYAENSAHCSQPNSEDKAECHVASV
jgi:hypothetical protein